MLFKIERTRLCRVHISTTPTDDFSYLSSPSALFTSKYVIKIFCWWKVIFLSLFPEQMNTILNVGKPRQIWCINILFCKSELLDLFYNIDNDYYYVVTAYCYRHYTLIYVVKERLFLLRWTKDIWKVLHKHIYHILMYMYQVLLQDVSIQDSSLKLYHKNRYDKENGECDWLL